MRPVFQPSAEDWPYLRRLAWTIVAAAVLVTLWRAAHLLLLAFAAVIGAVVLRSAARLPRRAGVTNERAALALGTLFVVAIIAGMGWLLGVQFGGEIGSMLDDLPGTLATIERTLSTSAVGRAIVDAVDSAIAGSTLADRLGRVMLGAGQFLVNFLIVLVGAIFIAASPRSYRRGLVLLTPPSGRAAVDRALGEIGCALRLWLKGKLIAMIVMGLLISGALWVAGVPSWAALGLIGGLSEFVPYVGPAVAMLPAIGLAATAGSEVLWRTIVAYLLVRLAEAYLLTPVVNREVVRIPPALTLFTILAAGAVFGVYGVFVSGALLVVGFVAVRELYLRDTLGEDLEGIPSKARD